MKQIELHLNGDAELPRVYGRRIKKLGGSYTRAEDNRRTVVMPRDGEDERMLIDTLVTRYTDAAPNDRITLVLIDGSRTYTVEVVRRLCFPVNCGTVSAALQAKSNDTALSACGRETLQAFVAAYTNDVPDNDSALRRAARQVLRTVTSVTDDEFNEVLAVMRNG